MSRWVVEREPETPPRIIETGLGKWQDERRTVCTMKDNSILSHEQADMIVKLREEKYQPPLPPPDTKTKPVQYESRLLSVDERIAEIRADLDKPVQSQFIRNDVRFLLEILAAQGRVIDALRELNGRVPRDRDGRPLIGIKQGEAVLLSNWVEPWIADAAALAACPADPKEQT